MRSGELAKAAGVSADTLHHYEKLGLLPLATRSASGYRQYSPDTLARVQMIRSAVRVGFSLAELAEVLKLKRAGRAPCGKVAGLAAKHLRDLDRQIVELIQLRDWLAGTVAKWNDRLQVLKSGERAGFLESLPTPNELNSLITKGNHDETDPMDVSGSRTRNLRGKRNPEHGAAKRQ